MLFARGNGKKEKPHWAVIHGCSYKKEYRELGMLVHMPYHSRIQAAEVGGLGEKG